MLLLQETEPNSKKLNPKRVQGDLTGWKVPESGGLEPGILLAKLTHFACLSVSPSGFILQTSIFMHTVSVRTMTYLDKSRLTFSSFASSGEALSLPHNNPKKSTSADWPFLNPCLCPELITVSREQATTTGSSWMESLQAVVGLMILADTPSEAHTTARQWLLKEATLA